ncbi:MAG: right-handed parallel beta-helix repeat-containing protein [Bacteroidales bacterium]|nr:MAG: right-handed parallel beta-helix repeat-containing protein [Bacteroidales bacterium]
MKRCIFITLIILGLSIVSFSQREDISYSYQRLLSYDRAENGDYVGKFYACFTYDTINSITFRKISGSDAYAINSYTGMIYIADNNQLTRGYDTVGIQVCDGGYCGTYYAIITVKDIDSCVFVNPDYSGPEAGTYNQPWNTWGDVRVFRAGYAYLQKRGTIERQNTLYVNNARGTASKPISVGAYGAGVNPIIDRAEEPTTAGIYLGTWSEIGCCYVNVYCFIVRNGQNGIYFNASTDHHHNNMFNCEVYNCGGDNGNIYLLHDFDDYHGGTPNLGIYNTISHHAGGSHGIKTQRTVNIINCYSHDNGHQGVSFHDLCTVRYVYSRNNGESGIELQGDSSLVEKCVSHHNNCAGITVSAYDNWRGMVIRNNELFGNKWSGINLEDCYDALCEYNVCYRNGDGWWESYGEDGIRCANANNSIVRYNRLYNNYRHGVYVQSTKFGGNCISVRIHNNKIHDNNANGININEGDSILVWNNTVVRDDIKEYAAGYTESINNIANDIDLGNFSLEKSNRITSNTSIFIDAYGGDFRLDSTAVEFIDAGESVPVEKDIDGNPVPYGNRMDIGAYEYSGKIEFVNSPPAFIDENFTIDDTNLPGSFVGKLSAYDPDTYQTLTFEITGGNPNGNFYVNPNSGNLWLVDTTLLKTFDSFSISVCVTDDYGEPLSDTGIVIVDIIHPGVPDEEEKPNHAPVIDDQSFVLYKSNISEDLIGQIEASDVDEDQTLSYAIISGNTNDVFRVNAGDGNLYIYNAYLLNFTGMATYNLIVQVTDNAEDSKFSSATITINLIDDIKTVYIDPSIAGDMSENGTYENPYNSWHDVNWQDGYEYLQKRNTTAVENKINIYASDVTIGSYGEGDIPVIESKATDFAVRAFERSNVTIKDLHIDAPEAISCIYFLGSSCDSNLIQNCVLEGADNGIRVIDGNRITLEYNTFVDLSDAIYSYAQETYVYYNIFKGNNLAINVSSYLSTTHIYNNVFYDNSQGVSTSYSSLALYNNIFYLTNQGDQAINHKLDNLVSDNNIFYPEQDGFIDIGDTKYSSLDNYQKTLGLDLNSYVSDPLFKDIYNDNFGVEAESPAIDAGRDVGLYMDFYGFNVPDGGAPDIGLIENIIEDFDVLSSTDDHIGFNNIGSPYIFPNPSDGVFKIYCNNDAEASVELIIKDMAGGNVHHEFLDIRDYDGMVDIDIQNVSNGIYIVCMTINDEMYTQKIIKN